MFFCLPREVKEAAGLIQRAGRESFLVGGALRDSLLGLVPKDWDLATDAVPDEVAALFRRQGFTVLPTGLRFGTVTVMFDRFPLEITTFRAERGYTDFRRPDSVRFSKTITEDLSRRDFTINALALNMRTGRLVDPFGGLRDLERGLVRAVGVPRERLGEDPLRMLRGFRLVAELGFSLEGATELASCALADLVAKVARERIRSELTRILLGGWAAKALYDLSGTGILFSIIPELAEGWAFPQRHPAHKWPVFRHLLEAVGYTSRRLLPRLAALLHDIGKPRCFSLSPEGTGRFYRHERLSAGLAAGILRSLRWDNRTCRSVELLVRWHMFPLTMGARGIRRLVLRVGEERMEDLLDLKRADIIATGSGQIDTSLMALEGFQERLEVVLQGKQAIRLTELAVNGLDVMRILDLEPGLAVGRVLHTLHQEVLSDPARNTRSYLESRLEAMARRNSPLLGE